MQSRPIVPFRGGELTSEGFEALKKRFDGILLGLREGNINYPYAVQGFEDILDGESADPWFIWNTVEVGLDDSVSHLEKALAADEVHISHDARYMLKRLPMDEKRNKLDLVLVSPEDLGFSEPVQFQYLYQAAVAQGLLPCPKVTAPVIIVSHMIDTHTLPEVMITVVSEFMEESAGYRSLFRVGYWAGVVLDSVHVNWRDHWFPGNHLVFALQEPGVWDWTDVFRKFRSDD